MLSNFLRKIFGDPQKKNIEALRGQVNAINALEHKMKTLGIGALKEKTKEFERRWSKNESLETILPEAFALVREASVRSKEIKLENPVGSFGLRHFDVQLIGGIVLHQGKIAEMKTGEGKTLVATLPVYLNALAKKGVHVVTVNDYLAKRDTLWMGPIYDLLGLSVGCIQHESAFVFDLNWKTNDAMQYLRPVSRREAYLADITYGTNNEFGFDYLRDNMVQQKNQKVQRGHFYAIVDEIDSILIDEARTPLIISAPAEQATEQYFQFASLVEKLKENSDYNIDEKMKAATLTDEGMKKMEHWLGIGNMYESGGISMVHHVEQALKAKTLFKKDRDYVIKNNEIIIVDEFTGRLMFGRRYSEGLHQAIEAKERVSIKQESITLATITFQNYFRIYQKLAGMTGTAATEAEEFHKIYNLEVIEIPTYQKIIRDDMPDKIYKTEEAKFKALVHDIKERHEKNQPVLVGTISIEKNEYLSSLLEKEGIPYSLLNAKNHEKEASIIAQAGKPGSVTVATNMAGRGTDIVLGGNPPEKAMAKTARDAGGLAVLGSERHEARRIDNQLRGRSGRLGDPGATQFYVSLEDDLLRIFGSDRIKMLMDRLGLPDDVPIQHSMVSNSIASAQKKVESHNFDIRKHLVEYDDVMNKHREVIYKKRNDILEWNDKKIKKEVERLITEEIETIVSFHTSLEDEKEWNIQEIFEVAKTIFPMDEDDKATLESIRSKAGDKYQDAKARTALIQCLSDKALKKYNSFEKKFDNPEIMHEIERSLMLRTIDVLWIEHLDTMQQLRDGIGLRGYGQRDPLVEYKKEGYNLFTELVSNINKQIMYSVFKIEFLKKMPASPMSKDDQILKAPNAVSDKNSSAKIPHAINGRKIGRNDPCHCGSGKKYKKCHGK